MSSSCLNLPAVLDLHSVLVRRSSGSHACQEPPFADLVAGCVNSDCGTDAGPAVAVHICHLKHSIWLQVRSKRSASSPLPGMLSACSAGQGCQLHPVLCSACSRSEAAPLTAHGQQQA